MPKKLSNPWWLWPNILSLDAPFVALSWQWLLHRSFDIPLPFRLQATLGIAVWIIYVLDRCLDVWKENADTLSTARHRFYRQYWFPMLALAVLTGSVMLWLARFHLHPIMFTSGIGLGVLILGYLMLVQRFTRIFHLTGLKEASVGILFAIGVTLNLWIKLPLKSWGFHLAFIAFAILCTLNCLLIHGWELTSRPRQTAWLRWTLTLLPLLFLILMRDRLPLALCFGFSSLGLALLGWTGWRLDASLRRVLVDAVLLTPLLFIER